MWGFITTNALSMNIAAGTQTATSGTVVFSNSNNVTFGMSGSSIVTVSISSAQTISFWQNGGQGATTQILQTGGLELAPFGFGAPFPGVMTASTFMVNVAGTASQSTASGSMILLLGIYTLNASTLSLLNSVSTQLTYAAVSNNSTAYSGQRWLTIHSSQWSSQPVFTQMNYWMGAILNSSNATQGFALVALKQPSGGGFGTMGVNQSASSSNFMHALFAGSVNTTALPVSVATSQISVAGNRGIPEVVMNNVLASF